MTISVIICTYNPDKFRITKVLESLKYQSLPKEEWELIIVDNNSIIPVKDLINLDWHPKAKIVQERVPGLAHARIKGVEEVSSPLIAFVDDDNILDDEFLRVALSFSKNNPSIGCFGGRSFPIFENQPPNWLVETGINLGCQDFGEEPWISDYKKEKFSCLVYPSKAPLGTGMVILKKAFLSYVEEVRNDEKRLALGRKGKTLTSGEDNDIILTIIKQGFEIAYIPELRVSHIIPAERYSKSYLMKMAFESNRSWVKVLSYHNICLWKKIPKWTYPLRKIKSFVSYKPWQSDISAIKWKGSCGILKGQSEL